MWRLKTLGYFKVYLCIICKQNSNDNLNENKPNIGQYPQEYTNDRSLQYYVEWNLRLIKSGKLN